MTVSFTRTLFHVLSEGSKCVVYFLCVYVSLFNFKSYYLCYHYRVHFMVLVWADYVA
jgi:hypothetical protein